MRPIHRLSYFVLGCLFIAGCASELTDQPSTLTTPVSSPETESPPQASAEPQAQPSDQALARTNEQVVEQAPNDQPAEAWRRDEPPLVDAGPHDVPLPNGGEASLLPFFFDPHPIESWRYDACFDAGECVARVIPQPAGARDRPAVGMRWEHADTYCSTRGLRVQARSQAMAIRDSVPREDWPAGVLDNADPEDIVTAGFRCVRNSE